MSVLFQSGKLCLYRKPFNTSFCKYIFLRKSSDVQKSFTTFDDIVAQRRAEARRSMVVQVNSESSFSELYGYCSKYATINGVHHYKNTGGEHFMLVEFTTEENLQDVLRSCASHQKDVDAMAVPSPFLWFRAASSKEKYPTCNQSLVVKDGIAAVDDDVLYEELQNCNTVSEQIQMLYDRTKLNDVSVRLRYMVARQLEVILNSLYANIAIQPFGSSVNGFGRMGCDLDLVLTNILTSEMTSCGRRLVYHEKRAAAGARHLELAAAALELRAPGAARVARVLHARVPIVKYAHEPAALHCDLCANNTSGVHMSALLWSLGAAEAGARPLAVLARRWAAAAALTSPHPARTITNYPLTLLVLFHLQRRRLLPAVRTLVQRARKEDVRIAEDNLNCTFLRDLSQLPPASRGQGDDSLEALLMQFFEFYAQFNFEEKAISLNEGTAVRKPNAAPLYIVNPLEQALNVSRNVSYDELERLKAEVRNAAWHLEASMDGKKGPDWGIIGLIEKKSSRELKKLLRVGNSHRLVSVKDLFSDKEDEVPEKKHKLRTDKGSVKETEDSVGKDQKMMQDVKYKNTQVRNEVNRIRRGKIL